MRIIKYITLMVFILPRLVFGQGDEINRKINWILDNDKTRAVNYSFYSEIIDKEGDLPYYFEIIKVNEDNYSAEIEINNVKTVSGIQARNNEIDNNIKVDQWISYQRAQPYLCVKFTPIIRSSNGISLINDFKIRISAQAKGASESVAKKVSHVDKSVLSTGDWYKLKIDKSGVYKLTYDQLIGMGISNPENIDLRGNDYGMLSSSNQNIPEYDLIRNSIYIEYGSDGVFNSGDYVLFYASGPDVWEYDESNDFYTYKEHVYSEANYYFISGTSSSSSKVQDYLQPTNIHVQEINDYMELLHFDENNSNLFRSGQIWFTDEFNMNTQRNYSFEIDKVITNKAAKIKSFLAAGSPIESNFVFSHNSEEVGSVTIQSGSGDHFKSATLLENFYPTENLSINVKYSKPSGSSIGWLDYITLNIPRQLSFTATKQLMFNYFHEGGLSDIVRFNIENTNTNLMIWDITNTNVPIKVDDASATATSFKFEIISLENQFLVFNPDDAYSPENLGKIENQNLHALGHQDMIIVAPNEFITEANTLADIHRTNDGLKVLVVDQAKIFNEFSSGMPDASAIRNFFSMIYNRPSATDTLRYVLLFGDGSYDNKTISAANTNYILTYQSVNSLGETESFVTDDFFGLLDPTDNVESSNSGLVDLGIGRFPIKNSVEANQIIDKINSYLDKSKYSDWINSICFVGDDEDNNLHMRDADRLAKFVSSTYPVYNLNKIYLDAYPQESSAIDDTYPEVNRQINNEVNKGVLIFNYTGHGGESGLAHERVVSLDDINSWKNFDKLALFMTATCEFSRFDDFEQRSAGEQVLLNPDGGGVALFTTTRLVYSSPNYTLNRQFYNFVFNRDENGNGLALGDIIRLTKNASGTGNNKRNFTLLGDPALKIPLPRLNIITDSINNVEVSELTDTINALSKVVVHGHVVDDSKGILTSYNGVLYPVIYDKKQTIYTLGNDGDTPMSFELQNNAIYKGKASVVNGKFKFEFIVPKDISYSFGNGKLSYFANSNSGMANGQFDNFVIGGTSSDAIPDSYGPEIKMYFNSEDFVSGGITDENPTLLATISDSSGVNTIGSGIGHDITAVLDQHTNESIILNNYYESNIDSYKSGNIRYLFTGLENGEHSLSLKVWDVYNNSNEASIDFIVSESAGMALKNVLNYPNPFTENTSFYFDHNRPNENLEVRVQIFTVSGKLVKTINTNINSVSYRSEGIFWDGLDDFGDKIGRGVYLYKLKVRSEDGNSAEKIEKLVILK